jgi:hypothetical protein
MHLEEGRSRNRRRLAGNDDGQKFSSKRRCLLSTRQATRNRRKRREQEGGKKERRASHLEGEWRVGQGGASRFSRSLVKRLAPHSLHVNLGQTPKFRSE